MTTYTKATNFATKDALLTGNPSKVVKGTEIDAEFTAIQAADATSLKSGASSSGLAFLQAGTGATSRTAQNKMRDIVSVQDFGAVGDGSTDDTAAVLNALQSGFIADGQGLTYAIYGQLAPSSFKGLRNATLAQKTAFSSTNATLAIIDISDFLIEDVTINVGSTTTLVDDDSSINGLKITTSVVGTFNTNFKLSRVTVTGNGSGSRFYIRSNKYFTIDNCTARDCIANFLTHPPAAGYNDLMNGFDLGRNSNFTISNCNAYNFTTRDEIVDAYTNRRTRGFLITEGHEFSIVGCNASEVDQGFDFSGGIDAGTGNPEGNARFTQVGCSASSCYTYGFKYSNVAKDGVISGCTSTNSGFIGFVVSAPSSVLADPELGTQRLTFVDCVSTTTAAANALWPTRNAGFRLMSSVAVPTWPRRVRFIGCSSTDTNSASVPGFFSDVTASDSSTIADIVDSCYVNAGMTLYDGFSGYSTGVSGTGSTVKAASPTLTGTPLAPTAAAATNTTQIATTAHVFAERTNTATLTNKTLTAPAVTGQQVITNTSAGAAAVGLSITNSSATASTEAVLDFSPSTVGVGVRSAQISAVNSGGNAISFKFALSNGGSPAGVGYVSSTGIWAFGAGSSPVINERASPGAAQFSKPTLFEEFSASAGSNELQFTKSRSATQGAHTIVQDGDVLGVVNVYGSDGTTYREGAKLIARVTGTPSTTSMPTRMELMTTPSGAVSPSVRLTVNPDGDIWPTAGTTTMAAGFFRIPAAAGVPTGVPAAVTGTVAMYYDTTNNHFYVYNGAWKKVLLA